jgi:hypothetical protein
MRALRLMALIGGLSATAVACTSLLGDFQLLECPQGQAGANGICVPLTEAGVAVHKCTDPGAPTCGGHGTCGDGTGVAVCACEPGYQGADCGGCAPGYADPDGDKVCDPQCSAACPARSQCVVQAGKAECKCVLGYALEGAACVWHGGPLDPGFEAPPPSPWAVNDGGTLEPNSFAADGGKGLYTVGVCPQADIVAPRLVQTYQMPSAAEAEPFALRMVDRVGSTLDGGGNVVSYGCTVKTSLTHPVDGVKVSPNTWTPTDVCFGDRGYGPNVRLEIGPLSCPFSDPSICQGLQSGERRQFQVDSIRVQPTMDCPAVGTVANGNFEGDGAWVPSGAGAEVKAGSGDLGSRAGRLTTTVSGCGTSLPSLSSKISTPLASMPSPELSFKFKGVPERPMAIEVANAQLVQVKGNRTYQPISVCLPEHAKGYVTSLELSMGRERNSDWTCPASVPEREILIDEFKITSQPSRCPAHTFVQDGDFERNDGVSYWWFETLDNLPAYSVSGAIGSTTAKSGSRALSLVSYKNAYWIRGSTVITVPPPNGSAGPVVKFSYRVQTAQSFGQYSAQINNSAATFTIPNGSSGNSWVNAKLCIPKSLANMPATLDFMDNPYNSGIAIGASLSPSAAFEIDAVSVETDPTCTL